MYVYVSDGSNTVTNGAVNFAQICVNFAKTISQTCADLRKCAQISRNFGANPAKFAQIRPNLHVAAFLLTYTTVYYTTVCSIPRGGRGLERERKGEIELILRIPPISAEFPSMLPDVCRNIPEVPELAVDLP